MPAPSCWPEAAARRWPSVPAISNGRPMPANAVSPSTPRTAIRISHFSEMSPSATRSTLREAMAAPGQRVGPRLRQIDPDFEWVHIHRVAAVRNTPAVEVEAQIDSIGEIADRRAFDTNRRIAIFGAKADRGSGLAPAKRKTIEFLQRIQTRLIQNAGLPARSGHALPILAAAPLRPVKP